MGRLTVHEPSALLAAAAELYAAGGARAVTMSGVARATGAPSGSLYHRFPSRGALLAALWQGTARDFEAGHREVLGSPSVDSAVRATTWIVEWCRREPASAAVLQAGRAAFEPTTWPTQDLEADQRAERSRARALRDAARTLAAQTGIPADEVAFALLGLPLAIVGTHLRAGRPVPAESVGRTRRLVTRLLTT